MSIAICGLRLLVNGIFVGTSYLEDGFRKLASFG